MLNLSILRKRLPALVGIALACGFGSQASAANVFTVNPNGLEANGLSNFQADGVSGTSSEWLALDPIANTATGSGWVKFTSFDLNSVAHDPGDTGLGISYGMYMTFTLKDTLLTGSLGQVGSTYTMNQLDFHIFYDTNKNNSYVSAAVNPITHIPTFATIGNTGDDKELGFGSLISGKAGINQGFGAFLNTVQTFSLTADGKLFFVSPDPFYQFALTGFNNSGGGVTIDLAGGQIAINSAVGVATFVPEPGSVALLGLGLLGLGVSRRNKKVA